MSQLDDSLNGIKDNIEHSAYTFDLSLTIIDIDTVSSSSPVGSANEGLITASLYFLNQLEFIRTIGS